MGVTYADVQVENLFLRRAMPVRAQVDSGAVFFTVPEHVVVLLGFDLTDVGSREVVLANGHREVVPMIGPLRVRFGDRYCDLSALVLGDAPLLGAVPMEMMDLAIHSANQTLTVNPDSPFVPLITVGSWLAGPANSTFSSPWIGCSSYHSGRSRPCPLAVAVLEAPFSDLAPNCRSSPRWCSH